MYMTQLLYVGAALLGLAALMHLAQRVAYYLAVFIAKYHNGPLFAVRPFNCRACLTFWATAAVLFGALLMIGNDAPASDLITRYFIALLFAFVNYFYIKTKIEVYE